MLIFLILDCSRSMNDKLYGEHKIDTAKKALTRFLKSREGLDAKDQIGMAVYPWSNITAYLLYPPFSASIKPFTSRVEDLKAKGASPMGEGLKLAFDTAKKSANAECNMVLIYDGEYNQGIDPNQVAANIIASGIGLEKIYIGDVNKSVNNKVIRALDEATHSKTSIVQTAEELYKALTVQRKKLTPADGIADSKQPFYAKPYYR
ncbi:MAG: VWA domain-containing protein [Candidatus Bathyarchaeota archaeon]|nr:VWA domain-containing protein [Candidatus Bathyarchaeota archaeon]